MSWLRSEPGASSFKLCEFWLARETLGEDVGGLAAADQRAGGDDADFHACGGERFDGVGEAFAALVGEWAKAIIGITRVAVFAGKAMADDVKFHDYRFRQRTRSAMPSASCVSLMSRRKRCESKG